MQRELRRADRFSGAPGEGRRFLGSLTVPAARRQPVAGSLLVTRCQAVTTSLVKPANTGPSEEEAPARCEKDLWLLAEDQAGTGPAPERVSARGGSPGVAGGGGGWIRSGAPERDPERGGDPRCGGRSVSAALCHPKGSREDSQGVPPDASSGRHSGRRKSDRQGGDPCGWLLCKSPDGEAPACCPRPVAAGG